MRHITLLILLVLPLTLIARQKTDDQKYLLGAVPEQDGLVTFQKSFTVTDKDSQLIHDIVYAYIADSIAAKSIQGNYSRISPKSEQAIVARVEEYMVFQKAFLSLDRTRFRFLLNAEIDGKKVSLTLTQISYYYNEDMEGKNGVTYRAEEWITDAQAVNKAGTKLYPRSGKFRRKTVDRAEAIFGDIMDAIANYEAAPAQTEAAPAAPVRKGIIED